MREIINTFEQFCKKLDKNIIVEERILNDGKRILKCRGCTDCKSNCKSIERVLYYVIKYNISFLHITVI